MRKKRFLNPEIDVIWFDEEDVAAITLSNSANTTSTPQNTTVNLATEGMNDSLTTSIKLSEVRISE